MAKAKNIQILGIVSQNHPQYNYMVHRLNYIVDKYRKCSIKIKLLDFHNNKNKNKLHQFNIDTSPSYVLIKDDNYNVYNGININELESKFIKLLN